MSTYIFNLNKILKLRFSKIYKVYKMHDLTFIKPQPFYKKTKQNKTRP